MVYELNSDNSLNTSGPKSFDEIFPTLINAEEIEEPVITTTSGI